MIARGERELIGLHGVAFGYGNVPVLADVDLSISAGEMVGIVGPNGAGKSTLLRGLLGLLEPLSGTVHRAPVDVGYVPQREALDVSYPLTVGEVVEMGGYGRLGGLRFLSSDEVEFARYCLERVGLASLVREPFRSLSGGQRQRALIARALMMRPRILYLDEPTAGIDRPTLTGLFDVLARLNEEDGLAILLVSHELDLTRRVVRSALLVRDGRVLHGRPEELLDPARVDELFGGGQGAPTGTSTEISTGEGPP